MNRIKFNQVANGCRSSLQENYSFKTLPFFSENHRGNIEPQRIFHGELLFSKNSPSPSGAINQCNNYNGCTLNNALRF